MRAPLENFGSRMRIERVRLGLSRATVAARLDIDLQTIARYEQSKSSPNVNFLSGIQDIGFNLYFLLFGERAPLATPREVPAEVRRHVIQTIDEIEAKHGCELTPDEKLQMSLMLLEKYSDEPVAGPLPLPQLMKFLLRSRS